MKVIQVDHHTMGRTSKTKSHVTSPVMGTVMKNDTEGLLPKTETDSTFSKPNLGSLKGKHSGEGYIGRLGLAHMHLNIHTTD